MTRLLAITVTTTMLARGAGAQSDTVPNNGTNPTLLTRVAEVDHEYSDLRSGARAQPEHRGRSGSSRCAAHQPGSLLCPEVEEPAAVRDPRSGDERRLGKAALPSFADRHGGHDGRQGIRWRRASLFETQRPDGCRPSAQLELAGGCQAVEFLTLVPGTAQGRHERAEEQRVDNDARR